MKLLSRLPFPVGVMAFSKSLFGIVFWVMLLLGVYRLNGGVGGSVRQFYVEIWFMLSIFYFSYFLLKDNRYRYWLALLPLLLFYAFYNQFYLTFGRVFKLAELSSLSEFFQVLPMSVLLGFALFFLILFLLYRPHLDLSRSHHALLFLLPMMAAIVLSLFFPRQYVHAFSEYSYGAVAWSERQLARKNGYITSTLYFEAKRLDAKEKSHEYLGRDDFDKQRHHLAQSLTKVANFHNLHLIVLEGYFDPNLFKDLSFNINPIHEELRKIVGDKGSLVASPIFGGGTAQAEFEILCGVPAYGELDGREFNVFSGATTNCLPSVLGEMGYRTIAAHAYKPTFYNRPYAYQGLGFSEIHFPKQYAPNQPSYLSTDDKMMFDGDLLEQNLAYVSEHIRAKKGPLFNYVLGVYGHYKYELDEARHPMVVAVEPEAVNNNTPVRRAFNQTYYRSQAIARYIEGIRAIDPNGLIVILGDHLPPLDGIEFYHQYGYLAGHGEDDIKITRAYFIEPQGAVAQPLMRQYQMQRVIYDALTDHHYCEIGDCEEDESSLLLRYRRIIAHAAE